MKNHLFEIVIIGGALFALAWVVSIFILIWKMIFYFS